MSVDTEWACLIGYIILDTCWISYPHGKPFTKHLPNLVPAVTLDSCCFLRIPISVMGNSVGNLGILTKYLYLVSEKWEVLWKIKVALSPWTNHS